MDKNTTIRPRTYRAIYRLLDRVSPVPFDCGRICGATCCDYRDDEEMGLFFLPGESAIHDKSDPWLEWFEERTEDYFLPESWDETFDFVRCLGPAHCNRAKRPIQCRSFPLLPHLDADGTLTLIKNDAPLPYCCPLIEDEVELDPRFCQATLTAWKHLIRDPRIYDLVEMDSRER